MRICLFLILSSTIFCYPLSTKKVFLIGDSISIQYGPYLVQFLGDSYQFDRLRKEGIPFSRPDTLPVANGQDSRNVLTQVQRLLSDSAFHPDVFLLNTGLHDIKFHPEIRMNQVPKKDYISNLDSVFSLLSNRNIPIIWVRTTPVIDSIHNRDGMKFHRYAADVGTYNFLADSICRTRNIPQIDLHSFTQSFAPSHFIDHVHFDRRVREAQGAYIAGYLHKYFSHSSD